MAGGAEVQGQPGRQGRQGHRGFSGASGVLLVVLAAFVVLSSFACSRPPHDGPIVLITFDSLRADSLGPLGGPPGLMPHLEELARGADWVGRGIAPSSDSLPALGTLLTGLRPWQHQALHDGRPGLSPELVTLAEALRERSYTTGGFPGDPWSREIFGTSQGFEAFARLGGRRAFDRLGNLGSGRHFVWIHLPEPGPPFIRRDEYLPRLGPGAPNLPRRIDAAQLEPFFDPATRITPGLRRRFLSMYRLNAAWADERLGRFLGTLRASGQWDRTLLVVTSLHGEELGEHGQILHGGNLGRAALEVPLVIKLPKGSRLHLRPPATQRVATARIFATLVEAAGGAPPPAVAPSLFRDAPTAVLSELYMTNGANRFSLWDGDLQLLQESRFAAPEPGYFRARQALLRPARSKVPPPVLTEPPAAVFARLGRAFDSVPCFAGDGGAGGQSFHLERWLPGGGTVQVDDSGKAKEMAQRLSDAWHRFVSEDLSPAGESSEWRGEEDVPRRGRWRKKAK